jgi:nuclear transport factor 2 (NTF2) superfamily protein
MGTGLLNGRSKQDPVETSNPVDAEIGNIAYGHFVKIHEVVSMTNLQSTSSPPPSTESKLFAGGGKVSSSPLPPFDAVSAAVKVRNAENAWNSRDPDHVALAYTPDSVWRNRSTFLTGRPAIIAFLRQKWDAELEYRLIKELWAFHGNRIAVRFAYESRDGKGRWSRSYGNENWEFDDRGLMRWRIASINDLAIGEDQRLFKWLPGPRPLDHKGLSELGL